MMLIDRRDIAQLPAGPETDALVAAVIGGDVLPYSSTWAGAGMILDWCHEHDITVSAYTIYSWWSSFQSYRGAKIQAPAATGPLAVCRGLLLWARAGGELAQTGT